MSSLHRTLQEVATPARLRAKVTASQARFFRTDALATTTSRFCDLLAKLDGRLHVVTTTLEFTQGALSRHLALQVLDCALDTTVADLHLEGPALH